MDIGRAFSHVFDDEEWVKKILIGGLISLIPLLGSFIIYGYMIEIVRRVFYATGSNELPEWDDFGGYLTRGFFFWLGLVLWALPFVLLIISMVVAVIFLGLATGESAVFGVSFILSFIILIPALMLFSLASALAVPILLGRFAIQGRFGAMFEFDAIFDDVRRIGVVPLLLVAGIYFAAGYVGQLGVYLCFIGVIFTSFYGQLAIAHAAGQTYRLASGLTPGPAGVQHPVDN